MDFIDRLRKYEPDKIALLAFFAVGLLMAFVMTATRYAGPAKAGAKIVQQIKEKGISNLLGDQDSQSFFTIKGETERVIGFAMSVHDDANDFSEFRVNSASLVYIPGRSGNEQITYFRCNEDLSEFNWRTELVGPRGRAGMHISGKQDGTISIINSANRGERSFKLQNATVPTHLFDVVLTEMMQSNHRKIIVDVIESDGMVTEAAIKKIRQPIGEGRRRTIPALQVELLDNRGYSQVVYFDDEGDIFSVLLRREQNYILDRSDPDEIKRLFPNRINQFLKR